MFDLEPLAVDLLRLAGIRRLVVRAPLILVAALVVLTGCGSPTPPASSGGSPSSTSTTPARPVERQADCSASAILAALPKSADMERFECAKVGDTAWAAARVAPGPTTFFLRWTGNTWRAEDSSSVCGTASAGLPSSLLAYCSTSPTPAPTRTSSPRPTSPSTNPCTSRKILAALPSGSTMQKYSCAEVNGTRWAAARVNPGATAFFLQWNGSRWTARSSDTVCGTASAGLPPLLLSYCP